MPEAAMHKEDRAMAGEHEIGAARESGAAKPISQPKPVERPPKQ